MSDSRVEVYEFGPFRLDKADGLLYHGDEQVLLAPKAFDTLSVLVENGGRLVCKDHLMSYVWRDSFVDDTNLTQNISIVRKALGQQSDGRPYIETISKRGYRFIAKVRRAGASGAGLAQVESPSPETEQQPRLLIGADVSGIAIVGDESGVLREISGEEAVLAAAVPGPSRILDVTKRQRPGVLQSAPKRHLHLA